MARGSIQRHEQDERIGLTCLLISHGLEALRMDMYPLLIVDSYDKLVKVTGSD
jgi:hypothetical protein